ncbi:helix-turn-helix transcriptional regulator [Halosimplex litoreum]|uniref:Helix-turn-helix transcriptional regulator n=1 Tax=Halosimplex litoreum TaxID=1198301 RepID=A0A7T3FZK2_9EURY|nr:helix-turn-helix domain-containing protein [Halosimplex litoreum]QPV63542.1 helix-turn-helix transcriptional regulator [Halosimplex litoreum]
MSDGDGGSTDPSEAFGLVANETRFSILRALWDRSEWGDRAESFAAIRSEAGVRDSGQFNYHLDKLTPEFVREVEEGYRLTEAGRRVVGAAVSGVYTDPDVTVGPEPAGECPGCGGGLELRYEDGYVRVECGDCDAMLFDMSTPPVVAAERDDEAVGDALVRHATAAFQRMNRGFCIYCDGPLDPVVEPPDDADDASDLRAELSCRACGRTFGWSVVAGLLDHPAVVAMLYEAGIDAREFPVWGVYTRLDREVAVASEDPIRIEASIGVGDYRMDLVVDGDLTVVDHERAR